MCLPYFTAHMFSFRISERRKANAYKTALCQSFKETGSCEYGDECCFAHGESELRLPPESLLMNLDLRLKMQCKLHLQAHPKYKTQLCNKFSVNGYCPYGSRCQFIHQKPNETIATKVRHYRFFCLHFLLSY
uniref:C3H1-type domain-containing protein n=1 Tax=Syphacia muris TaxID=451379 RepID=A0A0N5AX07_9BILA